MKNWNVFAKIQQNEGNRTNFFYIEHDFSEIIFSLFDSIYQAIWIISFSVNCSSRVEF